jgi:hypothetical protein
MDRLYATEEREGGTQAIGSGVPKLFRNQLNVLSDDEWEKRKTEYIYESWVTKARAELEK